MPATKPKFILWLPWLTAAVLALATAALYWPATTCGFVNYDDPVYVTENPAVQKGLTLETVRWALVSPVSANWHPLTMLSHMLDCQWSGSKPWGHHLTSLWLHAVNTALVFLLLRRLTGALWRSALVAALFGWHPLHVESVAWVAERKDVLSAFFFLLTLLAFVRHVKGATGGEGQVTGDAANTRAYFPPPATSHASLFYWLALVFFALGLMSKAMLVTLPCVLLLLDFWPLGRVQPGRMKFLVAEKIPFFVLTLAASAMTFLVQHQGGAVMTVENFPLEARIGNALLACCRYLGKLFWPSDLAVFYPHPGFWPMELVLLAGVFLGGLSALFFQRRRQEPFLLTGWLWFLGMLVPVIGLVQVGEQSMADRYTYLPSLGIFIAVVWGGQVVAGRWRRGIAAATAVSIAALFLLCAATRQQLGFWRDSETLFRHALAVTQNNELAHNNLGLAVLKRGGLEEAIAQLRAAVRLKPAAAEIHNNLALALINHNQLDEAIVESREAVRLKPNYTEAHINLGLALFKQGETDEAIGHFQETIRLKPDFVEAYANLGVALLQKNKNAEAAGAFAETIRLRPRDGNAHFNLGLALLGQGEIAGAASQFQEAIRLNPGDAEAQTRLAQMTEWQRKIDSCADNPAALNNLAWELATSPSAAMRNGALAVKLAGRACDQTRHREIVMMGTLAAAYAENGQFDQAVATGQKACALAAEQGKPLLLQKNQELVARYQARQPCRQPPPGPVLPRLF